MPKLRKNRRIETRWGVKYHAAVKNAVFITQAPYVPAEPPPSVKEHISECETLYMCAQCKDCFHFRSSLEDHIARKSWILGYWCQQCFGTICSHNSKEGSLCSMCMQLDREKRSYLRSRGLRKSQKFGAVRVFYNQCQFFAHLKTHNADLVHMGDLMLMPIPTSLNNNWSLDIDLTCEAIMEHTFILKVHIMDWLKDNCIEKFWWQLTTGEAEDNKNPVTLILKGYKGRQYFSPLEIPMEQQFTTLNTSYSTSKTGNSNSDTQVIDTVENVDKRTSSPSAASISDESVVENEDTPCTINDITFVDCGPTSKYFEPEIPFSSNRRKQTVVAVKSIQGSPSTIQSSNVNINKFKRNGSMHINCIPSDIVMSYGNTMITPKGNVKEIAKGAGEGQSRKSIMQKSSRSATPTKDATQSGTIKKVDSEKKVNTSILNNVLIIEPKTQSDSRAIVKLDTCKGKVDKLKQNIHTLTVNSGQKVVTFQGTKHVDINRIINQLPPHIINKKKIVFVGQTTDAASVLAKQDSTTKTVVHLVPDEGGKLFEVKKSLGNEKFSAAGKNLNKGGAKAQPDPSKGKAQPIPNKVVYQNGRKYIIKQSTATIKKLKTVASAAPMKERQVAPQSRSTNGIPALIPLKSTELESIPGQEKLNSFQGDVSPLTPSPSPSELSSSSSCDVQSKQSSASSSCVKATQKSEGSSYVSGGGERKDAVGTSVQTANNSYESLSFHKGEDQNLYLDVKFLSQKPIYTIVDTSAMITKCREEMLNEFFHLSYTELRRRYTHLQQTGEEISRVMDFVTDNVIKENLKAVNILQTVLKHCIDKCNEKMEELDDEDDGDDEVDEQDDEPLNDWESELERTDEKSVCKACNKITKPKHYIPGFSRPARNDVYCSCYRHVCHKCYTYQGNSTRFVAHQTFHDKEKPYLCPDCYRKFTAFKSLEVHTWTTCFHTLKKRVLGCKICEIDGFQDMESVARHFAIMHSHKKIACDKCYIVLPAYSDYRKHHEERHSGDGLAEHPIRLALCKLGRCIVRCEDYMLHMEKHLVVQRLIWFKCPFCSFIHVEARRIMGHLHTVHVFRLKELVSSEVLLNVLQVEKAAMLLKSSNAQQNKFTNAQLVPCVDGTVMPKIVNARTITSEVFERGAQVTEDYLMNDEAGSTVAQSSKLDKIKTESSFSSSSSSSSSSSTSSSSSSKSSKTVPRILDVRSMANPSSMKNTKKKEAARKSTKSTNSKEDGKRRGGDLAAKRARESRKVASGGNAGETDSKCRPQDCKDEASLVIKGTIKVEPDAFSAETPPSDSVPSARDDRAERGAACGEESFVETKLHDLKVEREDEDLDTPCQARFQDAFAGCAPLSKPPPLARIPRYLLDTSRPKKIESARAGKSASRDTMPSRQFPQRIDLNDPGAGNGVYNFACPLCGEPINTSMSVAAEHFRRAHYGVCKLSTVTANLLRMSSDFINGGYKDLLGNRKRKSENCASSSKRRRRWTPKKYSDGRSASFSGLGLCVKQVTAEDSEGNFRCKKCDQRCSDMADLREHIATNHRIRGRYLVCLECGDNFVVAPSLQMHLKAFHGIDDPISYMARNTSYAPENVEDLETTASKTIEANQCHVCMAVFEDKAAVDKHLRVHGMAFLNRKRIEARNALRSPEKKSDTEEEKSSPAKCSPKEQPVRKEKPAETILEKINATI